jgi:hypothetical protein
MTQGKKPFPQFDTDSFESPQALVYSIMAWTAKHDAERPHAVLIHDTETGHRYIIGPYGNAYLANDEAVRLTEELNDPKNNDGAPIEISVLEIQEP